MLVVNWGKPVVTVLELGALALIMAENSSPSISVEMIPIPKDMNMMDIIPARRNYWKSFKSIFYFGPDRNTLREWDERNPK